MGSNASATQIPDTGMFMRDLLQDAEFRSRHLRERRAWHTGERAFQRIAHLLGADASAMLQELVDIAVEFCEADSAGVSVEDVNESGERVFRWVAIAGSFEQYVNATTPRFFSPCGTTLDLQRPQLYRVTQRYYDFLGVTAEPILDGILIPWEIEGLRGTIWAVSHKAPRVFDFRDYELLDGVAEFVAIAIRQQKQLWLKSVTQAKSELHVDLTDEIYNPLQSVKSLLAQAESASDPLPLVKSASQEIERISGLMQKLLKIKGGQIARANGES